MRHYRLSQCFILSLLLFAFTTSHSKLSQKLNQLQSILQILLDSLTLRISCVLLFIQFMESKQEKHTKYTVSVRIKPNQTNDPPCLEPYKSKFIKQIRPKSIVTYCFDSVFQDTHDNEYIYQTSIKRTVDFFLHKKINTTILAYGQTGSGKTYTLFGHKNKNQIGLVDYIIEDLIGFSSSKGQIARCCFMQIYKQKVSDLMTSQAVQLRENSNGELILDNLKIFEVKDKSELQDLLKQAHSNKIFGQSYINSESSRSHVIFSIEIQKRKFNVVDLCGSQVLTYKFDQQQRDETNSINLSLFTLNAVVNDLAFGEKGTKKFIPFRNSVLTRILKESLLDMQKSQIYLFCNVSPEQKHQAFSASTLRFGQLAIQIDEANNIVEEKVNLSQEKREKKVVSNIIEVTPAVNKTAGTYKIGWEAKMVKIFGNKTKVYSLTCENAQADVLLLHAYGYGCCGDDWNLHVSYLKKVARVNIFSVDLPGFGESDGKKFTSRAEKFGEKEQPLQFMISLFETLGFSAKRKVILMGYDLGGAISLSSALHPKLSKAIAQLIVFHPTWTDSIQKLSPISLPTLILWVPVQTFHLISAGTKMAKLIKSSKMYKLNIGPYTNQKAGGYYDSYGEFMQNIVAEFIKQNQQQKDGQYLGGPNQNRQRGRIVQQSTIVNISQEEERLKNGQEAVRQVFRIKEENKLEEAYQSLAKGGPNKPKYIRLVGQLPELKLSFFNWQFCQRYLLFTKLPKNIIPFQESPFLVPGQQVHVYAKINLNALSSPQEYLAYDPQGEISITHKAFVSKEQTQQQMVENETVKIDISDNKGSFVNIQVPLNDLLYLNSPTVYKKNNLGHLLFEDSVSCNYNSHFVKLKILQCCFLLQPIVCQMDFTGNQQILLQQQKQCTKIIYEQIDLKHLVHEGIDNTRYTGIDVGRLAYYGQGNCHHLASVAAALLLPFGKLMGWDVIFRAGSFFKTGRELDQQGNPLPNWNGKPKINVQDHTWLEIRYKPSNKIFFFDPSFALCNVRLDEVYSFSGKMHISGKKLNFAQQYQVPSKLWKQ